MASYDYLMRVIIIFLSSSGVERSAVNRFVVGSNPTWGGLKMIIRIPSTNLTIPNHKPIFFKFVGYVTVRCGLVFLIIHVSSL